MKKSKSLKELQDLYLEWRRERVSDPRLLIRKSFSDKTANKLTEAIEYFFKVVTPKGFAWRVNNMGVYDSKLGRYRTSGTIKGIADISAILDGKALQIEVKIGKDRQSKHQKSFQERVEASGGIYLLVRSFDDFVNQINKHL